MANNAGGPSASYKYRNLPDIDTSAPDVYETDPTPAHTNASKKKDDSSDDDDSDEDQDDRDDKPTKTSGDSDEIVKSSLRRFDAATKFANATDYDNQKADFSGKLGRSKRRGKDAGFETSVYQSQASGSEESPLDRLRRLKYETSMLEEELAAQKQQSASADQAAEEVPVSKLFDQLQALRAKLAHMDTIAPSQEDSEQQRQTWEKETKSLLEKLSAPPPDAQATGITADANGEVPQEESTSAASSNVGALDRRLAELEETLGIKEALLDESKPIPKPILPTLQRLERQLQLLSQPRHLDAISRRVKVLVTELDRVHDSKRKMVSHDPAKGDASGITISNEDMTKLNQLFSVSTRLDPLLPLVPSLLTRLHTLSDLHASSAHFAKTLDDLEHRKATREAEAKETTELLESIERSLQENQDRMKGNLESLEERMAQLTERVAKLS